MPKLVELHTDRILRALARAGWLPRLGKPGKGHYVLVHRTKPGIVALPRHPLTRKGTFRSILRQAGLTLAEFERLYN